MQFIKTIALLFIALVLFTQCEKEEEPIISTDNAVNIPTGKGFQMLSEYHFFTGDIADLNPNTEAGVLPYDLNTALFSDYALKKRFVYVPKGSSIPYDTTGTLDLPVGSVLIKHFYYPETASKDRYIETRLLIHQADGWQPETYEWNAEQTDASRTIIGGTRSLTVDIKGNSTTFNYLIPNQNQCKNCHAFNGNIQPIGPDIHNLNKDYNYSDGTANQVTTWMEKGLLSDVTVSVMPKWAGIDDETVSLDERARAYLAVNCASCHRLEGSAANSGLYLEYDNRDSLSLGFYKTPVAAGDGSGGLSYAIVPGAADESILLYRMISDQVEERMPEIGRELMHEEGVALIRAWIDGM